MTHYSSPQKVREVLLGEECEQIFQDLKRILVSLPVLHKADVNLPLLVYIMPTKGMVSAALVQESSGIQYPLYFVSRSL